MLWVRIPVFGILGTNTLRSFALPLCEPRRFAGHSHWQNVRHTKEAKDKIKSALSQEYRFRVISAIKAGGGCRDPKLNSYLAEALAHAKANSVPYATLERVINATDTIDPYLIEVKAAGGLFVLIESCAKSQTAERQRIKSIVKKYSCTVPNIHGRIASEFFDHVGIISIKGGGNSPSSLDDATNLGIEVGATEVEELKEGDDVFYQFYCDPLEMGNVIQRLEQNHSISILSSSDNYFPKNRVPVTKETYESLCEMYDRIRKNHEHVDRIFDNVTVSEDT